LIDQQRRNPFLGGGEAVESLPPLGIGLVDFACTKGEAGRP
jgi:hypothetical protein